MTELIKETNEQGDMTITMYIDKNKLGEALLKILAEKIYSEEVTSENAQFRRGIREAVPKICKEMVYSQKDEIIDKVVKRATTEIVRKGLPKFIDKLEGEDE